MFQAQYRSNSQFWKNLLKMTKAYCWDRGSLTDVPSFKIKPKSRCESSHPCKITVFCKYLDILQRSLTCLYIRNPYHYILKCHYPLCIADSPTMDFNLLKTTLCKKTSSFWMFWRRSQRIYFLRILFLGILKIYVICLIQCSMLKNNPYSHDYTILMEAIFF